MSDRSSAQIIAEAREALARADIDTGELSYPAPDVDERDVLRGLEYALRAVVAALEAEGRLTPDASSDAESTGPAPVRFDPPLTEAESDAYWAAISDDPETSAREQGQWTLRAEWTSFGQCAERDPITNRRCWHDSGHVGLHGIGKPDGPINWQGTESTGL